MSGEPPPARVQVDLGNSRIKCRWRLLEPRDAPTSQVLSLPADDITVWTTTWSDPRMPRPVAWQIATVNPTAAQRLESWLRHHCPDAQVRWIRSCVDLPIPHELTRPEATGADRGLQVLAALNYAQGRGPGAVVSCGTALVVERIDARGVWTGGAIGPGLRVAAEALHRLTGQLPPLHDFDKPTSHPDDHALPSSTIPAPWGDSTLPALQAGLLHGTAGAILHLIARHHPDPSPTPWVILTGGDAFRLAPLLRDPTDTLARGLPCEPLVLPDLALDGLEILDYHPSRV